MECSPVRILTISHIVCLKCYSVLGPCSAIYGGVEITFGYSDENVLFQLCLESTGHVMCPGMEIVGSLPFLGEVLFEIPFI